MITAIVGAGGKTTLVHQLAKQYRAQGKNVFVTTTTHMFREKDTLVCNDAETIIAQLKETGYVMVGSFCDEKIGALDTDVYEAVCAHADEVLVEADGSKHMPIKYPNTTEPVIPANADRIIVVCGLHALNHPAKEVCHRLPLVKECLSIEDDTVITPEHIQTLVRKGYLERLKSEYPDKTIEIHASHDHSLYQRALAALINADLDVSLIRKEWFADKPVLFICGAGHVAKELAEFAAGLEFRVKVLDPRPQFLNRERFPHAEELICTGFDNLKNHLEPNAYYTVVTPGHQADFDCVHTLMQSSYAYLGMIGSRTKVAAAVQRLKDAGIPEEKIAELHAPIGLKIGAVTPAEIAISILAEIIQIKNKGFVSSVSSELLHTEEHGVLSIIIEKTGSGPRGVGSMMLVTDNKQIDTIGGGAVELEAVQDARRDPSACIRQYILNNETAVNTGMICGGTNKVLFLPI